MMTRVLSDDAIRARAELRAERNARTFREKQSYELSGLDDKDSGLAIAREMVKQSFLDRLGSLVDREMAFVKHVLGPDQVRALLSGLIMVDTAKEDMITMEMPEYDWMSRKVSLEAKVVVSPKIAAKIIALLLEKRILLRDMVDNRAAADWAMREIERMQRDADVAGDREELARRYRGAVGRLVAVHWFEKGQFHLIAGEPEKALEAYTSAIEASSDNAAAYKYRGALSLYHQNNMVGYEADLRKALAAYGSRAQAHIGAQEYDECLADVEAALEISTDYAYGYYQRATCRRGLGRQAYVREDLLKAARLGNSSARDLLSAKGISWQISSGE